MVSFKRLVFSLFLVVGLVGSVFSAKTRSKEEIRKEIQEKTKNMTPEQRKAFFEQRKQEREARRAQRNKSN